MAILIIQMMIRMSYGHNLREMRGLGVRGTLESQPRLTVVRKRKLERLQKSRSMLTLISLNLLQIHLLMSLK